MKRWTILMAVFFMISCSGCSVKKRLSEPVETISPTPQIQQPTTEPDVSNTPTSTNNPNATTTPTSIETEPTETTQPGPAESPAATTSANPAKTQKPASSVLSVTETPDPTTPTPTEAPKVEPTVPPITETPAPTAPPSSEPESEPVAGLAWEDYNLADALNDNKEFLTTYVDTPTNLLIMLLGFDGLVDQIKDTARENVTLTDACIPLVGEITDINVAAEYHLAFIKTNSRMATCNERTLEVKQSRDIGSFESALNDTLDTLQDYQALLASFKDEVGG